MGLYQHCSNGFIPPNKMAARTKIKNTLNVNIFSQADELDFK